MRVVPEQYKHHAHHWLILHGRYICKARAPDCPGCLINDLCRWPEKTDLARQTRNGRTGAISSRVGVEPLVHAAP